MSSKIVLSRKGVYMAGAVVGYLTPKLAQDKRVDVARLFEGFSSKNSKERLPKIETAIRTAAKSILAKDANLDDLHEFIDRLDKNQVQEGHDTDPNSGLPLTQEDMVKKAARDKRVADRKARDDKMHGFLKDRGMNEDSIRAYDELMSELDAAEDAAGEEHEAGAATRNEEGKEKGGGREEGEAHDKEEDGEKVSRKAMDAAIDAAVKAATSKATTDAIKLANEIASAREFVAPWVGKIAMDAKSPEEVYKVALDGLKVKVDGVHPSAYKKILELQPQPGKDHIVNDEAIQRGNEGGFRERWGGLTDRFVH